MKPKPRANVSGPLTLKTPSPIPGGCPEIRGLTLWDVGSKNHSAVHVTKLHGCPGSSALPSCWTVVLCSPHWHCFWSLQFPVTTQQLVSLVQTMKLCWTWQPTALVSLHKGAGSCDPHQSFPRHGCGLLFTWYNCQAYCDPSWREPWSSFPWLQGGGCLSSPRPSNGSLGWLRGCHQLLEFLDSNPNSPSQRDWLLVSWVSDLWDSWILQLGRFS